MPDPVLVPFAPELWQALIRQPSDPIVLRAEEGHNGEHHLVAYTVFSQLEAAMILEAVTNCAREHGSTTSWVELVAKVRAIAAGRYHPSDIAPPPAHKIVHYRPADPPGDQPTAAAIWLDRWLAGGGGRGPVGGP